MQVMCHIRCKGPSIINVGNWEGSRGQKLVKIAMNGTKKNCRYGRGGCKKFRNIADVIYGWSLTRSAFRRQFVRRK